MQRESRPLTPREKEVLKLIAWGHRTVKIAERLGVSVKTVEAHKSNIKTKMRFEDVSDFVLYAFDQGWMDEPTHKKKEAE